MGAIVMIVAVAGLLALFMESLMKAGWLADPPNDNHIMLATLQKIERHHPDHIVSTADSEYAKHQGAN
jgi:hypothetical protein